MKIRYTLLSATLMVFALCLSAMAQKPHRDIRPLTGRPTGLPTYKSLQEYLIAHPAKAGASISSLATPVGQAKFKEISAAVLKNDPGVTAALTAAPVRLQRAQNGTVCWMTSPALSSVTLSTKHGASVQASGKAAMQVLQQRKAMLRLNDPEKELTLMNSQQDALGYTHVRYQQTYMGFPVWASDLYVHFDAKGNAYAVNGRYNPTPGNQGLALTVTADEALEMVIADLQSRDRWAPVTGQAAEILKVDEPKVSLVIYPTRDGQFALAYQVELHPNLLEHYIYIVNGLGGGFLDRIAMHCSLTGKEAQGKAVQYTWNADDLKKSGQSTMSAGSFTNATATDLNGANQSIRTYQQSGNAYFMVWDLPNLNQSKSNLPNDPSGGSLVIDAKGNDLKQSTQLQHVTSSNNSWSDRTSVSAAVNGKLAYDYYITTHNRKAIDGNDQSIISVIHVTEDGQSMDNAFWNGRQMAYGDGATAFKPLAGGKDVAGHEMTHGVVENTAGLVYQDQAGALNESFADVFGIMIDRDDFLMGEDIMQPGQGIALRDLQNPANTQVISPQPAHMNNYDPTTRDNGGVHINSGIPNRACVLLIQAIGREKTEKIYYRALSKYLTRNSQFIDCRNGVEQAAKDLFGDATEAAAVRTAFSTVGIGAGGGSNGGGDDVPPQTGGSQYIAFAINDGSVGLYDIGQNKFGLFQGATSRVSQNGNSIDRAQLSITKDGKSLYYVNQQGLLAVINTTTGQVSVFNNLQLKQAGDIYNASISPNGQYVALVSAYNNDPNLYITDGNTVSTIPLKPETSQDGIQDNTIQYPDVVSWSPNMQQPLIAFDALRAINVNGTTETFWSMYEINFANQSIYNLVPSQSFDVSVGNIAYSTVNPDVIAYNYIDANGVFDIIADNFDNRQSLQFNLPNKTIGGSAVNDGQRPSFSPDGSKICFSSPANKALGILDFGGNMASVTFPEAVYNPVWFVVGGQVGVQTESAADAGVTLSDAIPNPFSGTASVGISLPRSMPVTVQVTDMNGATLATVYQGQMEGGRHTVSLDAATLPSGTYLVRLMAGTATRTRKVVVVR